MTCTEVEPELVAFHFGLVEGEPRAAIEAHLASCRACLQAFLEIKRAVETAQDAPAPSQASPSETWCAARPIPWRAPP